MDSTFNDTWSSQGLQVVALDPDTDDIGMFPDLVDYVNYLGPPKYSVGIENSLNYNTFATAYEGSNPFPVDVLVGKDGTIRYIAREYDPQTITQLIPDLLAE